jgi:hypothetical protein
VASDVGMTDRKPRFSIGDSVYERFPFAGANREIGIVVERYEFENEYRYVVKFETGREIVFFEKELQSLA